MTAENLRAMSYEHEAIASKKVPGLNRASAGSEVEASVSRGLGLLRGVRFDIYRQSARDIPLQYQSKLELVVQTVLVSLGLAPARLQDAIPTRLNRHLQHVRAKAGDCDRHCVLGPLIADKSLREFCLARPFP